MGTSLTFPTGVAFDDTGRVYVIEAGYSYGEAWATPRQLRLEPDGRWTVIATGGRNGPWNGVTFHQESFYVAEGGEMEGGRILRIRLDGTSTPLIEGLRSLGDHHTNGPVIGPDGLLYFGQGTATNAAVVGEDNAKFGWLARHPGTHDIPCQDITLAGQNFTSSHPLQPETPAHVTTGAFSAFGTQTASGQVIRGQVPCNGAILRLSPTAGSLISWPGDFAIPLAWRLRPTGVSMWRTMAMMSAVAGRCEEQRTTSGPLRLVPGMAGRISRAIGH
jgi:hypothetical protein